MNAITALNEPSGLSTVVLTIFGYLLPFAAFYFGIFMRFKLRPKFFPADKLTPMELTLLGVLFSLITVAPLLPSFAGYTHPDQVHTYLMTLAVVVQGGLFMPESVAQLVRKQQGGGG